VDKKEEESAQEIRSDQIYWFDSSDERARDSVTVRLLVSMIDSVIVHFKDRIPPYNISGRSRVCRKNSMICAIPNTCEDSESYDEKFSNL
jgi:superfamily II helicase